MEYKFTDEQMADKAKQVIVFVMISTIMLGMMKEEDRREEMSNKLFNDVKNLLIQ
jgi:hypothetical protein